MAVAVAVAAARLLEQLTAELGLALQQQPENVSAREAAAGQALQDGGSLQQRRAGEDRTEGERVGGVGTEAGEVGQAKLSSRTVS